MKMQKSAVFAKNIEDKHVKDKKQYKVKEHHYPR